MTYLLDTHVLIWTLMSPDLLSRPAFEAIESPENRILVSAVNFWEISLKYAIGKLDLQGVQPEALPSICENIDLEIIALEPGISAGSHLLKAWHHRDPFDRMLIWQAIQMKIPLITKDPQIGLYSSEGLECFW